MNIQPPPSAADTRGEFIAKYDFNETRAKHVWTLEVFVNVLRFTCPTRNAEWNIPHAGWRVQLGVFRSGLFSNRMIALKRDGKAQVITSLPPDAYEAVKTWIGPLTLEDIKEALKQYLGWTLLSGFLYILPNVLLLTKGASPNLFTVIYLVVGVALLLTWGASKLFPHRAMFLVGSAWFAASGVRLAVQMMKGTPVYFGIFLLFNLFFTVKGVSYYRLFAPQTSEGDAVEVPRDSLPLRSGQNWK